MKITGLNSFNYSNRKGFKNSTIPNFSGHLLVQDNRGKDYYRFFLPNTQNDTYLVLSVSSKNKTGDSEKTSDIETIRMPNGYKYVDVDASSLGVDKDSLLLYKFYINGQEYLDNNLKTFDNFNVSVPLSSANSTRPRQMYHMLVDAFNTDNPQKAKRNHFNLLGGTLNSVNEKISQLADFGVRNILGTPIFGQDNKSSHGYWTTNPYQITANFGNFNDFRNLMQNMFSHGMSWTADGAFVNEGMEGVHIKDILNYGENSPFWPMFETKDVESVPIRFGIFSKNDEVDKHTHIKLVNAPYRIIFEKTDDGYKEGKIVKNKVDNSKPTYIQVFDDRLASEEQINGDEIFNVYDIKEASDRYEIANYKDSVQAYNFRVNPDFVEINYKKYREAKSTDKNAEFKNALVHWPNFTLVKSNKDGGVSLWVGNSDIAKKRFVVPELELERMGLTPEKRAQVVAAPYQVQDDTVQVGRFWSASVANMLTEYAANLLINKIQSKNISYEKAISELVEEKKLPQNSLDIIEKTNQKSPLDNILSISRATGKRNYNLKAKSNCENITDGLMSFPLDAIEFSADLLSVFAYPYIKNLAVTEDTVGLSRYEMYKKGEHYYSKMPKVYRNIYKSVDKFYAETLTSLSKDIVEQLQQNTGLNLINVGELTPQGKEIFTLIAPDIMKFLVVSSLVPDIKPEFSENVMLYDLNELKKVDLNKLGLNFENSPESTARALVDKLKNGVKNINSDDLNKFVDYLSNRVANLNSDSINVARLIVEKTESGMDWRIDAAKDVGGWESLEAQKFSDIDNKNAILSFWNKFNKAVREKNSRSYTIGELTDWNLSKAEFLSKTSFTTMSDYEYFFNNLAALYGQDSEGKKSCNGINILRDKLSDNSYFASGTIDSFNFAHRFVGNQDKPRILHLLSTNVSAFNDDKSAEVNRVIKNAFSKTKLWTELTKNAQTSLIEALDKLSSGIHTVDGVEKNFDTENFGIRPFEYSINDAINEAMFANGKFKKYVEKNPQKIEKFKAETLQNILEPAMKKYKSILFAMVAIPGTPTNYAGDELGMTGWETFCKNEKQENRNALRWHLLDDNNYKFIKDYRDDLSKIMNIRNKEAACPLVNGTTIPLENQKVNGGGDAFAMYRYNDKTDSIIVLHSHGFGPNPEQDGMNDVTLNEIKVYGLGFALPKDVVYCNALKPQEKYKSYDGNIVRRIDENGNPVNKIDLGTSGLILLRDKSFNGKELSFKGRVENPQVKLLNTKYNFAFNK